MRENSTMWKSIAVTCVVAALIVQAASFTTRAEADTVGFEVRPGALTLNPEGIALRLEPAGPGGGGRLRLDNIVVKDGRGTGQGWSVAVAILTSEDASARRPPTILRHSGSGMGRQLLRASLPGHPDAGTVEVTIQSQ